MDGFNDLFRLRNKKKCIALRTSSDYLKTSVEDNFFTEIKNVENVDNLKIVGITGGYTGIPVFIDESITDRFEPVYE